MNQGDNGLDEILKNLNSVIEKQFKRNGKKVLFEVGMDIFADSKIQCPIETAVLINGAYIVSPMDSKGEVIEIGYQASYAPFVHEMVGANFTGPRSSATSPARKAGGKQTAKAKFLEDPVKAHANDLIMRLAEKAKVS